MTDGIAQGDRLRVNGIAAGAPWAPVVWAPLESCRIRVPSSSSPARDRTDQPSKPNRRRIVSATKTWGGLGTPEPEASLYDKSLRTTLVKAVVVFWSLRRGIAKAYSPPNMPHPKIHCLNPLALFITQQGFSLGPKGYISRPDPPELSQAPLTNSPLSDGSLSPHQDAGMG